METSGASYLAAKYGGGIFLLIYIILAMTFGYTMIVAETSIGRMTGKKPGRRLQVFSGTGPRCLRWLDQRHHPDFDCALLIPSSAAGSSSIWRNMWRAESPNRRRRVLFFLYCQRLSSALFLIFTAMTLLIIFAGVENGIERVSRS